MDRLEELLVAQHRVIRAAQAQECGLSRDVIATRVRSGEWVRCFHGIYAVHPLVEAPLVVRSRAALMYAGTGAAISHGTALALLEGSADVGSDLHVSVQGRSVKAGAGLQVHWVRALGPVGFVAGVPCVSPPAAVVGAWATATDTDAGAAAVCHAVVDLRIPVDVIQGEMQRPIRIRRRRELAEVCRLVALGCHSPLEMRYYRDVERDFRLPSGERQRLIRTASGRAYRVDVVYGRVVVELDGQQHWATAEARHADLLRDAELRAAGYLVLRFTWRDVMERPGWCAAAVRAAIATAPAA